MIFKYFRKHPAYQQLKSLLTSPTNAQKYLPITEIFGVTASLYEELAKLIVGDLKAGIIAVYQDNQEIRKYLENSLLVVFKDAKANQLIKSIIEYGYKRAEKIEGIGDYSVKGDILSFWPPGFDNPVRVSFFDELIESAVIYDEIYGKTISNAIFFLLGDIAQVEAKSQFEQIRILNPELTPLNSILIFGGDNLDSFESSPGISFDFEYPSLYFKRFDLLEKDVKNFTNSGYEIQIYTKHKKVLPKSLQKFTILDNTIGSGFLSKALKLLVLTDKELFGTVFLGAEVKRLSSERARKILANLEGEIEIGDFIVHEDHGVGVYKGIKQEEYVQEVRTGIGEKIKKIIREDYILIAYAEGDELYVPLRQIDKLTKYISIDDQDPEITRLGKTDWENIRRKTKESIFAMAKELVELYAKREVSTAIPVNIEDSSKYEQFVNDFPYQTTPDQEQTENDINLDLSKVTPMNRIIVGDVGFGKTEIAMRAVFKVVENGYQSAVLCPTTVLAAQHEKVFKDRFAKYGVNIETLSRLNNREKQGLENIKAGKADIVIGTHRLLSGDISFKKLGLIVIDEEQKFGVKQKEKLKQLEIGVHVLSMSATPIPRSLSMALSNIYDISIIQTPPEGRKSIENIVTKMDYNKIKSAIEAELSRNGQIYYVHNRVQTINSAARKLKELVPKARIVIAHGQMAPSMLTKNVTEFYEHKYDVLLCTTIIENGLDMPNVNTIIIEHAQNFGLGQMYQLRGRVGRGDKQAYAFFFYDGDEVDHDDSEEEKVIRTDAGLKKFRERRKYKKRLQAIKEVNQLGAGFSLASRDLEIRGAGNLLGKQQHGNIKQIGYALYMQMLAEEIEKLKVDN